MSPFLGNNQKLKTAWMLCWTGLAFLFIPIFNACQPEQNKKLPESPESIIAQIRQWRQQKDHLFKNSSASPLLDEDKNNFTGLKYYPIDLRYRFEGAIVRYQHLNIDTIWDSHGNIRLAVRYGYFEFTFNGKKYRLQIYKFITGNSQARKHLFLGFTDATSGTETYGGGRYIDLEENPQNHYVVDFNMAYNPYCAYNPRYSCALPPKENHLPFPVRAGEKLFKPHK